MLVEGGVAKIYLSYCFHKHIAARDLGMLSKGNFGKYTSETIVVAHPQ